VTANAVLQITTFVSTIRPVFSLVKTHQKKKEILKKIFLFYFKKLFFCKMSFNKVKMIKIILAFYFYFFISN